MLGNGELTGICWSVRLAICKQFTENCLAHLFITMATECNGKAPQTLHLT